MAAGFASIILGPVGWVLAPILTILVVVWLRRRPLGLGGYLLLLGVTGLAILLPDVIGNQACPGSGPFGAVTVSGACGSSQGCSSGCYSPADIPALVAYAGVCFVGLGVGLYGLVRFMRMQRNGDLNQS